MSKFAFLYLKESKQNRVEMNAQSGADHTGPAVQKVSMTKDSHAIVKGMTGASNHHVMVHAHIHDVEGGVKKHSLVNVEKHGDQYHIKKDGKHLATINRNKVALNESTDEVQDHHQEAISHVKPHAGIMFGAKSKTSTHGAISDEGKAEVHKKLTNDGFSHSRVGNLHVYNKGDTHVHIEKHDGDEHHFVSIGTGR